MPICLWICSSYGLMMNHEMLYPVFLKLSNLQCLVVGGGTVAERKIVHLVKTGAKITVVSPRVTETIHQLFTSQTIIWIQDKYKSSYMDRMHLVISATNNPLVNDLVFHDATERRIFINSVDDPDRCSFMVPASGLKGDVHVAVCTSGAAPGFSAKIRDSLIEYLSSETVSLVHELKRVRERIKALSSDKKAAFWKAIHDLDPQTCATDTVLREKIESILTSAATDSRSFS